MKWFLLGIVFGMRADFRGRLRVRQHMAMLNFRADQQPSAAETPLMAMDAVDASMMRLRAGREESRPAHGTKCRCGSQNIFGPLCGLPRSASRIRTASFSRSFYPPAPGFFKDSPDMPDEHNFYVVQHGIRWTGMPAWSNTLSKTQMREVVTFLGAIENLPPRRAMCLRPSATAPTPTAR